MSSFRQRLEPLLASLADDLAAWQTPGLALTVVQGGEVVCCEGFGVRDLDGAEPVDADTTFCIASCTKGFTATAVALLAHDGRLSLDDLVIDHLPWFRLSDDRFTGLVTIRDLLAHRVGVEEAFENGLVYDERQMVELIRWDHPVDGFRARYVYNSLMYAAAGELVRAATGSGWRDVVRSSILDPLGMGATTTSAFDLPAAQNHAGSHFFDDEGRVVGEPMDPSGAWTMDNHGASASMNSTATDLASWLLANLGHGDGALPEAVRHEVARPQMLKPKAYLRGPEFSFPAYGLGWEVCRYRGTHAAYHTGLIRGHHTVTAFWPELDLGIAVMANARHAEIGLNFSIGLEIADALLEVADRHWRDERLGVLRDDLAEKTARLESFRAGRPASPRPASAEPAGWFWDGRPQNLWHVARQDGRLRARLVRATYEFSAELSHWSGDTYAAEWSERLPDYQPGPLISFEMTPAGQPVAMSFYDDETSGPYRRLVRVDRDAVPDPAAGGS